MKRANMVIAAAIIAGGFSSPNKIIEPETRWRPSPSGYKGSGTGKTGHNVSKSRAKAKAARKASKLNRKH